MSQATWFIAQEYKNAVDDDRLRYPTLQWPVRVQYSILEADQGTGGKPLQWRVYDMC